MNIWVLVDEYELMPCSGANALAAYSSENKANNALEVIAKQHGAQVFRLKGMDPYTVFCCDVDDNYQVNHRVHVCQTQMI